MVAAMAPGSVIVDLAVESGGNVDDVSEIGDLDGTIVGNVLADLRRIMLVTPCPNRAVILQCHAPPGAGRDLAHVIEARRRDRTR